MAEHILETPVNKNSQFLFVQKATEILTKIAEHAELGCTHCKSLLNNKSGFGNQPNSTDDGTIPEPPKNDHV